MNRRPTLDAALPVADLDSGGEGSGFENQSVARVGQILALFGPSTSELTAAEVAELLELNRTTAYRYLASLAGAGVLERGQRRGSFALGGLMLQLGILALDRKRVLAVAPPYLRDLSAATSATALLSVWGVDDPIVAYVQDAPRRGVVVTVRAGSHIGMGTSQMAVFLAHHGDQDQVQRMLAGLTAAERLQAEAAIYDVRRTGYGVSRFPSGLFGIAAPVFDEFRLCATVAILGADSMADLSEGSPLVVELLRTAAALGAELVTPGGARGELR